MKIHLRRLLVACLLATFVGCNDGEDKGTADSPSEVEVQIRSLSRSHERLSESVNKLTHQVTDFERDIHAQMSETQKLLDQLGHGLENSKSHDFMNVSTHYAVIELLSGHAESMFKEVALEHPPDEIVRVLDGIRTLNGMKIPIPEEAVQSAINLDWSRVEYLGGGAVGGWTSYVLLNDEFILVLNSQDGVKSLKVCERPNERTATPDLDAISTDFIIGHPLSPVLVGDGVREVYQSTDGTTEIYKKLDESLQEAVRRHFRSRLALPREQYDLSIPPWVSESFDDSGAKDEAEQGGADRPATAPESKPGSNENPEPESEGRSR